MRQYLIIFLILYVILCLRITFRCIRLWDWVNRDWYNYLVKMIPEEVYYIRCCQFYLFFGFLFRPFIIWFRPYLPYLSSFTYGVDKNGRGRMGWGYTGMFGSSLLEKVAMKVLKARGMNEKKIEGEFYGLGWNWNDDTIRMYYLVEAREKEGEDIYDTGLKAWTGNMTTHEWFDEKDYVFPRKRDGAWMWSSARAQWIFQNNFTDNYPKEYEKEVKLWKEKGFDIDTVSHWGDEWVLYFPRINLLESWCL